MNRKQFLTLVVLGLVIGGLGIYLNNRQKESYTSSSFQTGQKVIRDFPLNETAHIRIQQGTNEVNLVRGEQWTVKERWNYPANYSEISEFLRKMWELKPVQDVEVGASQYGRLELVTDKGATNSGTLVEFKDGKNTNLKTIVLGKKHTRESQGGPMGGGGEFPVGRYVLVPGNPGKVWLVNETFSGIETKPEQWLNKDFVKVEKVKSVEVMYPAETNSWKIARESETGEWKLADVKPEENFDASKASSLNYAFSSPSFNDVASPELSPEESGLSNPTKAKLETFDGFIYALTVSTNAPNDNAYLKIDVEANLASARTPAADEKPEDKERLDKEFNEKLEKQREKLKNEQRFEKWTYLVSKWTVDSLLKDRKDFMAEKKEEEKKPESTSATPADPSAPPIEVLPSELKNVPPLPAEPKPAEPEAKAPPVAAPEAEKATGQPQP